METKTIIVACLEDLSENVAGNINYLNKINNAVKNDLQEETRQTTKEFVDYIAVTTNDIVEFFDDVMQNAELGQSHNFNVKNEIIETIKNLIKVQETTTKLLDAFIDEYFVSWQEVGTSKSVSKFGEVIFHLEDAENQILNLINKFNGNL